MSIDDLRASIEKQLLDEDRTYVLVDPARDAEGNIVPEYDAERAQAEVRELMATDFAKLDRDQELEGLTEEFFRAQREPHRRMNRKPQAHGVTPERVTELVAIAADKEKRETLTMDEAKAAFWGPRNGIFGTADLTLLQAAELRRQRRNARNIQLRERGGFWRRVVPSTGPQGDTNT